MTSSAASSPRRQPQPVQNDEVTQELMDKIQNLMVENEELKLKNSVLQTTIENLSTMAASPDNNSTSSAPADSTEWH